MKPLPHPLTPNQPNHQPSHPHKIIKLYSLRNRLSFANHAANDVTDLTVSTTEPTRKAQKVNLEGLRNLKRPERDLELPMSPIGHPSDLDFLDASSSSLSLYEELPKVSTQKVPHLTVLDSFGPPITGEKRNEKLSRGPPGESPKGNLNASSTSCMTESVFPVRKKSQTYQSDTWSQWTEQTVPAKRNHQAQMKMKQVTTSQGAHESHSNWDKSYDHEVKQFPRL